MQDKRKTTNSANADRMGRFIGQMRVHEGITLSQLAHGLCSVPFLHRIENGEREVGKQMTDAFFQRLGKPVELFERILDWDEFQQWSRRQEIIASMRRGDVQAARAGIQEYLPENADVLDRQFAKIIEINCRQLEGAAPKELLTMVCDALELTQPGFQTVSVDDLLLSQNEGRLLFAYLQLKERMDGFDAVSEAYAELLRYFKKPRHESRERVYLFPYVACRVIESEYTKGHYAEALTICEEALEELTAEKRLFAYDRLLEWKQKLYDATSNEDRMPEKLLTQLKLILNYAPKHPELLIPCDERGNVYCLNHVIRDRRKLLGISQEAMAEGICEPRTLSRIENDGGNLHRKNRRLLLQRVNMSGERYDYEIITDRYEDYLLRSELDRAVEKDDVVRSAELLSKLRHSIPNTTANIQFLRKVEWNIRAYLPVGHPEKPSADESVLQLTDLLCMTLPLDLDNIHTYPPCVLSVNETVLSIALAFYYKRQRQLEKSLDLLTYVKRCFEHLGTDPLHYADSYLRIMIGIASAIGDLGHYDESDLCAFSCVKLALESSYTRHIEQCLYGIAWNRVQKLSELTGEERELRGEEVRSLLKQAYAAAFISGSEYYKRFIGNYYLEVFGTEMNL